MESLIQQMNRIEKNLDRIYIRHNGETILITEAPARVAVEHIFKWLREVMILDEGTTNRETS